MPAPRPVSADLLARPKTSVELTKLQKTAVLMLLFGERAAAAVLKNLSPVEVQNLGAAMYAIGDVVSRDRAWAGCACLYQVDDDRGAGRG